MTAPGDLLPVAILAGGLAKRMRPLTEQIPKALIDIDGEPFIAHQLRLLRSKGIGRVVVCVGYLGERIQAYVGSGKRFGLIVDYSFDGPVLLGTAGALRRALPQLGDAFFVLYGDSYLTCTYLAVQRAFFSAATAGLMTVFRNENTHGRSNVEFVDGALVAYDKWESNARMRHIDYGLGVLTPHALDTVPEGQPYDLARLYQQLLVGGRLAAFEIHERFYEIGSWQGLAELRGLLAPPPTRVPRR